ncbi:MAG: D-alanyl-D-alanine dipeptidase [Alphaproteobacteria bacterium]|nr:D-alanyl-D-alanine dipeptidase [Alphaproteobacteria bacterium]
MALVEIAPPAYDVVVDLRYATADNLTGQPIYRRSACYLHEDAAQALRRAMALAEPLGLRLHVFDAYRPPAAQWALWNHMPNSEFIADPRRGSHHSRGVAVDLTLAARDGRKLEMGTGFDAITPLSYHADTAVSHEAQRNRLLLLGLMSAAGWDFYSKEWWHYQLFQPRRYPLVEDGALAPPMM